MQMDSIQDSTRYIVSNIHHGNIIPGKRMEMWRDVFLLSGADIRGGIFCGSITINGGPVSVENAVYCKGPLTIKHPETPIPSETNVTFSSSVSAVEAIISELSPVRTRFLSDVYSDQINISNAFVYGNIFTKRAIIRNSIVLGGIFCEGSLSLEKCMVSTFEAKDVHLGQKVNLFMPVAIGHNIFELTDPVQFVTFFNLLQKNNDQILGETIVLTDEDILSIRVPKSNRVNQNKNDQEFDIVNCLSIAERILDLEPLREHYDFNKKLLENLALWKNLDPASESNIKISRDELEKNLWRHLEKETISEQSRTKISIKDLYQRIKNNKN
jgi:hypothetical protein